MEASEIAEEFIRLGRDATPGKWAWFGNTDAKSIYLATVDRGRVFVMDFVRWGKSGAAPRFNGILGMKRADEYAVYEVCLEAKSRDDERVYRADFHDIGHPDARYIAFANPENARTLAEAYLDLLDENARLRGG